MAGEHDLDIGINIRKTGDGAGAAAADLNATKDAAKQASGAVDQHGNAHASMRGKIRGAREEMHALSSILRGDLGEGLSSAGRGLYHLGGSFMAWTGVGAVVSVVAGALVKFAQNAAEARAKQQELNRTVNEGATQFQALEKVKLDFATKQEELERLRQGFDAASEAAQALFQAEQGLAGEQTNLQVAQQNLDYERQRAELVQGGGSSEQLKMLELQHRQKVAGIHADAGAARAKDEFGREDDKLGELDQKMRGELALVGGRNQGLSASKTNAQRAKEYLAGAGLRSDQENLLAQIEATGDARLGNADALRAQIAAGKGLTYKSAEETAKAQGGDWNKKIASTMAAAAFEPDTAKREQLLAENENAKVQAAKWARVSSYLPSMPGVLGAAADQEKEVSDANWKSGAALQKLAAEREAQQVKVDAAAAKQRAAVAAQQSIKTGASTDVQIERDAADAREAEAYRQAERRQAEEDAREAKQQLHGIARGAEAVSRQETQRGQHGSAAQLGNADFTKELHSALNEVASGGDSRAALELLKKALGSNDTLLIDFATATMSSVENLTAKLKAAEERMKAISLSIK